MQQRAEPGRLDMRVSSRRERRVEVRREWESEQAETRSSLCTDLLSREHFNYSTLLTKFQLWLSQASSKKETARECEREKELSNMICCLSSQKFGAQKLVYNKNNLRLLTVQKARGSRSPKYDREREGELPTWAKAAHTVCASGVAEGGGGHEQGQFVCLLCQAYALLLLALA